MNPTQKIKPVLHWSRTPAPKSNRAKPFHTLTGRVPGFLAVLGLALCTGFAAAQNQPWETVDDISPGANVRGIAADAAGNVFAAGTMTDASGVTRAIVMKSSDQGESWDSDPSTPDADEPTDTFTSSNGSPASFTGIASAAISTGEVPAGNLLVTSGTAEGSKWLVRRSLNAGVTWQQLDLFSYSGSVTSGGPVKPAIDNSGNIYVAGTVTEQAKGKTTTHHLIRRYAAASGTWSTIPVAFSVDRNTRLVCSGGSLFAVSNSAAGTWQVRKSTSGGTTWGALLDEYRFDPSSTSSANDAAMDSQGNLFVVGFGHRVIKGGSGKNVTTLSEGFWIVRKGAAGGTQWTTVDTFDLGRLPYHYGGGEWFGARSIPRAVAVDLQDNVHVTGSGVGPTDYMHWVTRRLSAETGAWTTTDDFNQIPGVTSTQGWGISADPAGNLFSAGFSGGQTHNWLVRRSLTSP